MAWDSFSLSERIENFQDAGAFVAAFDRRMAGLGKYSAKEESPGVFSAKFQPAGQIMNSRFKLEVGVSERSNSLHATAIGGSNIVGIVWLLSFAMMIFLMTYSVLLGLVFLLVFFWMTNRSKRKPRLYIEEALRSAAASV